MKLVLLFFLIVLSFAQISCGKINNPKARKGEIDLTSVDFNRTEPIPLSGQWKFNWEKLISPEESKSTKEDTFIKVPRKWNDTVINNKSLGDVGYATYRLKVKVKKSKLPYTIWMPEQIQNYNLYINGELKSSKGTVGKSKKTSVPRRGNVHVPFTVSGNEFDILIQLSNFHRPVAGLTHKIFIHESLRFHEFKTRKTIIDGILYGSIFIMAIYHLTLAFMVRKRRSALFFGLYAGAVTLRGLLGGEVAITFAFYPDFPWELSWKLGYIGFYLSVCTAVAYFQCLIPNEISKWFPRVSWSVMGLFCILALVTKVHFYEAINLYPQVYTLFVCLVTVSGFVWAIKHKRPGSLFVLIGFAVIVSGAVYEILMLNEVFSSTTEYLSLAVFTFILFQSVLIAGRFSNAFKVMSHSYQELSKIVYKNVIDRIHQGQALEATMPTNKTEATVISLDTVGSANIKHPRFGQAIENIMARCYKVINNNYDPNTLISDGYRVKEMGDGLIVSIGYPFQIAPGKNVKQEAVRVAEEFIKIFKEEIDLLKYPEDIFCVAGIAHGSIEGYFPHAGIKQYDLRGRAIILAKRYEQMRKVVFKRHGHKGNLIFMHKLVYDELEDSKKSEFTTWEASEEGARIRDDLEAKLAYFKFLPHSKGVKQP